MHKKQKLILEKITTVLEVIDNSYLVKLIEILDKAKHIYITGAGRSKLVGNFLAMRLMHCGYNIYVVGEIVTTSIKSEDILIVISGSGETKQLITYVQSAKEIGAEVVLISAKSSSTIAKMADQVFQIGNIEYYTKTKGMPLGTIFELTTLIFLESLIAHIICEKGISEESVRLRHANLE